MKEEDDKRKNQNKLNDEKKPVPEEGRKKIDED